MKYSIRNMEKIIYIRHGFRGPFAKVGTKEIIIKNGTPEKLKFPTILEETYSEDLIEDSSYLYVKNIINQNNNINFCKCECNHNKSSVKEIIADLSVQRVFETGKKIAICSKLNFLLGAPTKPGIPVDYLVQDKPLDIPPDELEELKKYNGNKFHDAALDLAREFIYNLGIDAELLPDPGSKSKYSYLGLPDWIGDLIEVIGGCGGFINYKLVDILSDSGWPKPKVPEKIFNQATTLDAYAFIVSHPLPEKLVGLTAKYINEKFFVEKGNGTAYLVTHDNLINSIIRAFLPIDVYPVFPYGHIIFEKEGNIIVVYGANNKICASGTVSVKQNKQKLGILTKDKIQSFINGEEVERVKLCFAPLINK